MCLKSSHDISRAKDVIGYMINKSEYKKAYLELYEIIKKISLEDKRKIPEDFIEYLKDNMDTNYSFKYDNTKSLLEQNIKVETKALLVKLYENYLAKPEEKNFWNQYNKDCFKIEENKKINDYYKHNILKKSGNDS